MPLTAKMQDLHRPQKTAAIAEVVTNLSTATTPPTADDLKFPLTGAATAKLAAAINEVDTSGQPAVTADDLKDPWCGATVRRLYLFTT